MFLWLVVGVVILKKVLKDLSKVTNLTEQSDAYSQNQFLVALLASLVTSVEVKDRRAWPDGRIDHPVHNPLSKIFRLTSTNNFCGYDVSEYFFCNYNYDGTSRTLILCPPFRSWWEKTNNDPGELAFLAKMVFKICSDVILKNKTEQEIVDSLYPQDGGKSSFAICLLKFLENPVLFGYLQDDPDLYKKLIEVRHITLNFELNWALECTNDFYENNRRFYYMATVLKNAKKEPIVTLPDTILEKAGDNSRRFALLNHGALASSGSFDFRKQMDTRVRDAKIKYEEAHGPGSYNTEIHFKHNPDFEPAAKERYEFLEKIVDDMIKFPDQKSTWSDNAIKNISENSNWKDRLFDILCQKIESERDNNKKIEMLNKALDTDKKTTFHRVLSVRRTFSFLSSNLFPASATFDRIRKLKEQLQKSVPSEKASLLPGNKS